jgi:poly(hydroxyalkanoate) granule-associated protein
MMVKKLKELAGESQDKKLTQTVRDSAQQIWLAGLGAFSKAQEEGGKVFEALVKEGRSMEEQTRKLAESKIAQFSQQVGKATTQASGKATQTWDKLEQVFEDRVARALGRLGVPTNRDLQALTKQVESLAASMRKMSGEAAPRRAAKKRA